MLKTTISREYTWYYYMYTINGVEELDIKVVGIVNWHGDM